MPEGNLPEEPAKVFLLIENRLVRETLIRLFRKRSDLCVVGHASSAQADQVLASNCDILVLDELHALEPLEPILSGKERTIHDVALVLLGMEEDEADFLSAVRFGISAYLLNDASTADVVTAVRTAARGEAHCPPRLCRALFRLAAQLTRKPQATTRGTPCADLTIRQQQLISLVAKGLTNKEIASALNLSEFTVKNHMHRIMKHVDADTRSRAVELARASGYTLAS